MAPVTPRLTIDVPLSLQRTFCPFLEEAEKAYMGRLNGGAKFRDVAFENKFKLVRVMRPYSFSRGRRASPPPQHPTAPM